MKIIILLFNWDKANKFLLGLNANFIIKYFCANSFLLNLNYFMIFKEENVKLHHKFYGHNETYSIIFSIDITVE